MRVCERPAYAILPLINRAASCPLVGLGITYPSVGALERIGPDWDWIWIDAYLLDTYEMKLGEAGFIGMFMLQAALILGIVVGGWISDAVAARSPPGRMALLALACVAAAPFSIVFLWPPQFAVVAAAVSVGSFFRGVGIASERPVVCDIIPTHFRATAFGIMNLCATASGALGVFLAGMLKGRIGLNAVFATASSLNLIPGVLLLLGARYFMAKDIGQARAEVMPCDVASNPNTVPHV